MRYWLITLLEVNGEVEYYHLALAVEETLDEAQKEAEYQASIWNAPLGESSPDGDLDKPEPWGKEEDGSYWFDSCRAIKVYNVREIPKAHFSVLQKYL